MCLKDVEIDKKRRNVIIIIGLLKLALVSRHILLLLSVLMCWSMYKEGHLQWEPKLWDKAPNADEIYRQFSVD